MSEQLFYLQDSRTYCGNDLFFWATAGGYTTDVSKARLFTKDEALAQHQARQGDDIPWPKEYIDAHTRPAVDHQYVKAKDALAGTGIDLIKPTKLREDVYNCIGCGKFLNAVQRYCSDCPHCGADNRP